MQTSMRSHLAGELHPRHVRKSVRLCGWCARRRDHGGIIFIDLRDRSGIVQLIFDPRYEKKTHALANSLRREDCIQIHGVVKKRRKDMINPHLKTGGVEVVCRQLRILTKSPVPPIEIDDKEIVSEDTRLQYRYLDLRRAVMQRNMLFRHRALQATREFFTREGFIEIETPHLVKPTPEGARDYLVPSRVHPGKFYALPQSPQMYKQVLMIAGFDRYFQIARCFRDEDLRQDRQPEFTQLDLEMTFVDRQDIFRVIERWMVFLVRKLLRKLVKTPFLQLPYQEAIARYGTDKPDLRFGLEMHDVTDVMKSSTFSIFQRVIQKKGVVKCIAIPHQFTRKKIEEHQHFCLSQGAKGLAWLQLVRGKHSGPLVKFVTSRSLKNLQQRCSVRQGTYYFIADTATVVNAVLGQLRLMIAKELQLQKENELHFSWVTDFPLFTWNKDTEKLEAEHHPFTGILPEDIALLRKDLGSVRSQAYDLVLNGVEIGSGSIRIHDPELQAKIFQLLQLDDREIQRRFGFFIEALRYAPPHGGIAPGFDRLIALLLGYSDIREVIAFPKNKAAENPMDGSPSTVDLKQLKDLHLSK